MADELNLQAERAAFEGWFAKNSPTTNVARRTDGSYEAENLNALWDRWLVDAGFPERRAAPVAQLDADLPPHYGRFNVNGPDGHRMKGWTDEQMRQYAQAKVAPYVERIRHLERELEDWKKSSGLLAASRDRWKDAAKRGEQPAQSIDMPDWRVGEFWSSANPGKKVLMLAEGAKEIESYGKHGDFIRWIDGRTAGTVSEAAPDAWVYECRQPLTDPVVWAEFFGRDKPSASTWVRNVRPLAYIGQHAAAKPLCPHCGTHEVELSRTCHNSACTGYATPETIYEGWIAAAPSTQEGAKHEN